RAGLALRIGPGLVVDAFADERSAGARAEGADVREAFRPAVGRRDEAVALRVIPLDDPTLDAVLVALVEGRTLGARCVAVIVLGRTVETRIRTTLVETTAVAAMATVARRVEVALRTIAVAARCAAEAALRTVTEARAVALRAVAERTIALR